MDKTRDVKPVVQERHLKDYWRVTWNGRWTVLSIFAVVVVVGTVATLLQKPVYEAVTTLEINARPRGVVPGSEVAQLGATEYGYLAEERYFNTQFQILRSRAVARLVMEELNLYGAPAFAGAEDPEGAFIKRVIVDPVQETGLVRLRVRAGDPELAAEWANTLADKYVSRNLKQAVAKTEEAVNALVQRMQPLREELLSQEEDRLQYAGDQALYTPDDAQKSFRERLSLLEKDLTETQVKRLEVQGVHDKIQEIEAQGGDFLALPRVTQDPTVRGLVEDRNRLETELRKLLVTYKQGHHKVRETQSELEKVQQKIDGEVQRIVAAVETEYSMLSSQERELQATILETRQQSLAVGRKASQYEVIKTESSETRKIYDLLSSRIKEVRLNANLLRNNVAVVDQAMVPTGPVSPKRRLNVALSAVLGLFLGLGAVFFLDYLDNTVKTSEDVEQYLGMSILAIIPRKDANSESMVKESLQSLRTNISFSSLNRSRRTILLTSAGPQEGKTSTLVSLARAQASAGDRVVVVDCDLRRPNVHNHLKIKRNFGLTNYLVDASEESSWRKYLKKQRDLPTLDVLTCGPIPPNPSELFGTQRFQRLLDELKQHYHWVLIDSPPVASLTDSVILASMVDMVAFVIRHRQNDRELVRRCVDSIRSVNPHVIGTVLNDVDLGRSHYRDYYYAGHYYYGGEHKDGKEPRKRFLARRG